MLLGATSFTARVIVVVVVPPLFIAVIVYTVEAESTVGVPEISPVTSSILRPLGKSGLIE